VPFGLTLLLGEAAFTESPGDLGKPNQFPSSLRIAVMMTLAQNLVPSFRTRQFSSSQRPSRRARFQ
jgi:hypothetical protein